MVSLVNERSASRAPSCRSVASRRSRVFAAGRRHPAELHLGALSCTLPSKGSLESAKRPLPAFFNLHSTPKFFWKFLRRIPFFLISTLTVNDTPFRRKYSFC